MTKVDQSQFPRTTFSHTPPAVAAGASHVKPKIRDPLLSEAQAAELLDVKPTTLQVWRMTNRYPLEYVKIGRNVRYRLSAIEEFIDLRTVRS